jgi:soluble lytic murein transglycosylase-like protein
MRSRFVILRCLASACLGAALCALPGPARADIATLKSGRSIEVAAFRLSGDRVELSLPGGGQITLPATEVLEIRRQALQMVATPPEAAAVVPAGSIERATGPIPDVSRPSAATVPETIPVAATPPTPAGAAARAEGDADLLPAGATDRRALMQMASKIARRHGVAEPLVHAVIEVESRYNPKAVSRAGAMGLMQLMPKTADRFSVADAFDPVQNVDAGVRYLKELLERYSGQVRLALAAYNAGEDAVERHGGIPPYRETIDYVKRVQRAAAR